MKSLRAEKEIPKGSKILQLSPFLVEERLIRVELFLQNEHKDNQQEGTEHVRNIVQQKMWILGIWNALRSIKNNCATCRKGTAQTIAPVIVDLPEERAVT